MTDPATAQVSIARQLALTAGVALSVWLSIDLTRLEAGVAAVFVSNGLVVGVLLLRPAASWPLALALCTAASIAVRLAVGDTMLLAVGRSLANLAEIGVILGGIRRVVRDVRDPALFIPLSRAAMISTLIGCGMSALLAALVALLEGERQLVATLGTWYGAHVLGMVVVATLTVVALRLGSRLFGRRGERLDLLFCLAALLAACGLVFVQSRYPLLFLTYLPLVLLAFRHGFAGVVLGMALLAACTVAAAAVGSGPFALVQDGALARTLLAQLYLGAGCALALPVALGLTERRRLQRRLQCSEHQYRLLASQSRDLVIRLRADGERLYISPSSFDLLGWRPEEMKTPTWERVHEADRAPLAAALGRLLRDGGDARVTFRLRHKAGHYVWIEMLASRVEGESGAEVICSGRDVTARVAAERALATSQARLQAVTDNIPALIAHFDRRQCYTFVNAYFGRVLGVEPSVLLGRRLSEVWGGALYAQLAPHVEAALAGERRRFEGEAEFAGTQVHFHTDFVPDVAEDGHVRGAYALSFDITALTRAREALERLARVDSLTGLANRREFDERLALAVARARRSGQPLVLLALDIDRFKGINDTFGHAAGDVVLQTFASRLQAAVYEVDLVARLGGDEFTILIEAHAGLETARHVARRILEAMRRPVSLPERALEVTTSIGIGVAHRLENEAQLLALADAALYDAKRAGRDGFAVRES